MSWTSPTTRATGDLITASIWNTDVVNNLIALRGTLNTASVTVNPGVNNAVTEYSYSPALTTQPAKFAHLPVPGGSYSGGLEISEPIYISTTEIDFYLINRSGFTLGSGTIFLQWWAEY